MKNKQGWTQEVPKKPGSYWVYGYLTVFSLRQELYLIGFPKKEFKKFKDHFISWCNINHSRFLYIKAKTPQLPRASKFLRKENNDNDTASA
jgi:hypothetical protein